MVQGKSVEKALFYKRIIAQNGLSAGRPANYKIVSNLGRKFLLLKNKL